MTISDTVAAIAGAARWDDRVALLRQVPAEYGTNLHAEVYRAVAAEVYASAFGPDFAYLPWRESFELEPFLEAYEDAVRLTDGFTKVSAPEIEAAIVARPHTLRIFRTIVGYLPRALAVATQAVADDDHPTVSPAAVARFETGHLPRRGAAMAATLARLIDGLMDGSIFADPEPPAVRKQAKPDTADGWRTVQGLTTDGVPYGMFLHQRHYGGAFRQLLDATGTQRGDLLEDAVERLAATHGVPYIRTGSHDQAEIEEKFGLAVRPAPDFVFFDESGSLRALLECKGANDGGTARDKARRFDALRQEANRLGGIPLIAVLSGLGWRRTGDALGPVVRDTDGRVFTLETLDEMMSVSPFPQLLDLVEPKDDGGP